jgi:hypothetical protein
MKFKHLLFFISLVVVFMITSCATSYNRASNESTAYQRLRLQGTNNVSEKERMIIYNATVNLTVKNIDSANAFLTNLSKTYEGYVIVIGNNRTEIRVKSSLLNNAITELNKVGKIESKTIYGRDVTEEYFDYEIRLDNAKKSRQRYLELLQKAENVETTLKVEKELERLNGEIDTLEGKLNRMSHLTEYSTININLEQKEKLGILGYVFVGLYKGISWLFIR